MKEKIVIYQVLPRLFGNRNTTRKENGSIEENGCGKLNNFNDEVLARIHDMGFTHIWFTGVIRHATQTNYSSYGIPLQSLARTTLCEIVSTISNHSLNRSCPAY